MGHCLQLVSYPGNVSLSKFSHVWNYWLCNHDWNDFNFPYKEVPGKNHQQRKNSNKSQKISQRIESYFIKNYSINLKESHSIWYSKKVLFEGSESLLAYIQKETAIQKIKIDLASWALFAADPRLSFKLDLLFEFPDLPANQKFASAAIPEIKQTIQLRNANLNDTAKALLIAQYANTGLPCPPAKCP